MSTVLQRATEHFRNQLEDNAETIDVPEWGDGNVPLTIYYKPMTAKQSDAIFKYVNSGEMYAAMVEALVLRARHEDGKPIFRPVERSTLMTRVDRKIIERVVTEMRAMEDLLDYGDTDDTEESKGTSAKKS